MYVRKVVRKGQTYYEAVETVRDSETGRKRNRTLAYLGKSPTLHEAYNLAESKYWKLRKGRMRERYTPADGEALRKLYKLWQLAVHHGEIDRGRAESIFRERQRWDKQVSLDARKARYERSRDRTPEYLAVLGLAPDATLDQIRSSRDRLAKQHHPDLGGDPAIMIQINEAYDRLTE